MAKNMLCAYAIPFPSHEERTILILLSYFQRCGEFELQFVEYRQHQTTRKSPATTIMALNPTAITALTERADHLIRRQRISLDDPMGSDSLECPYQDLNFAEMLERNGWSNPDTDPDLGVRPRSIDNVDDCLEAIGVSKAGQWGTKAPERLNQFVSIMNEKPFLKDGERRSVSPVAC